MTRASPAAQEELFASAELPTCRREQLESGAFILRAFAADEAHALLAAIELVSRTAPLRHTTTIRGWQMSVAMDAKPVSREVTSP
jgi:alkylated DNA repair protein (DNA oxidative demethylase)